MDKKPRANERLQLISGVLRVTLLGNDAGMIEGDVCNISATGAGVHLATHRLPSLRVDDETILTFHRPGGNLHLTTRAVLRHSVATDGAMHYGFAFVAPDRLRNQLKGELRPHLCSLFNARGAARVELDPAEPLKASLSVEARDIEAIVRVANLSGGGLAVEYTPDQMPELMETDTAIVVFPNPSDGRPMRFVCTPRGHRTLNEKRQLGLEFSPDLTEDFESKREAIAASCAKLQADYLTRAAS